MTSIISVPLVISYLIRIEPLSIGMMNMDQLIDDFLDVLPSFSFEGVFCVIFMKYQRWFSLNPSYFAQYYIQMKYEISETYRVYRMKAKVA